MSAAHRCTPWLLISFLWGALSCAGGGDKAVSETHAPVPLTCAPAPSSGMEVNVKNSPYGAKGDGVTNDTSAIQAAVNAVKGTGGRVIVPAGTYLINPVANNGAGIRLGSDMTLHFESGAIFQALSTSTSDYAVLLASNVQNLNIIGGTIRGNRNNNTITDTREGGEGLQIVACRNVFVDAVTSRDCWEDGFYIGEGSQNIVLCKVVADNNRRHGMGVSHVDGMLLQDCTFKNSTGLVENQVLVCGTGVDIEPNQGEIVNNVMIAGCTFSGNSAEGLALSFPLTLTSGRITNVVIDGNTATGNGFGKTTGSSGIGISNTSGHTIRNNIVRDNLGDGIYLTSGANGNTVTGNTVSGSAAAVQPGDPGNGIMLYRTAGNSVSGNTVTGCAGCGIRDASPSSPGSNPNRIGTNTLSANHPNTCP